MTFEWIAAGLVIVGSILGGIVDDWSTAPVALALQYLGVVVLIALTRGIVAGTVALVTAVGVLAILVVPSEVKRVLCASQWQGVLRNTVRNLRWFDLSVTILAIVGATALMIEHPLGINQPVEVVVAVLLIGSLAQFIVGRPVRHLYALVALVVAVCLAVVEVGHGAATAEILLGALLQLVTALAVDYFDLLGMGVPAESLREATGDEDFTVRGLPLSPHHGDGAAP